MNGVEVHRKFELPVRYSSDEYNEGRIETDPFLAWRTIQNTSPPLRIFVEEARRLANWIMEIASRS
jgi:hypothetical protein